MHISLPSRTNRAGHGRWLGGVLLAVFLATLAVATAGALVVFGSDVRATHDVQRAHVIDDENRSFCLKLGMGPETTRFGQCAAALNEIRTLHEARTLREAGGML